MIKVSVITVCFNCASTIRDAIESVLGQRYPYIEYIIVDGGSTDGTMDVIAEYKSRVACLTSGPDRGIYDAMNKGIGLASGDVVGFLNADDLFAGTDTIEKIAERFGRGVDVCYGDLVYVKKSDTSSVERYWKSGVFGGVAALGRGWIPPHPSFYAKRELLLSGFDLRFRLAADYELMLRLLLDSRLRVGYIPEVLVRMRVGGVTNKNLKNVVAQNLEILRAAKRCGLRLGVWGFLARKVVDKVGQRVKGKSMVFDFSHGGKA